MLIYFYVFNLFCFLSFVLSCALKELETLGKELYGAKIILQRFQVRKCAHVKNPVPASECLLSMLEETNPHHYFIATQVSSHTGGKLQVFKAN